MWRIIQHEEATDFVIATGENHSVREFCEIGFREAGMEIEWRGSGQDEVAILVGLNKGSAIYNPHSIKPIVGSTVVSIDARYFRPTEVDFLMGDASKARKILCWEPRITFAELTKMMVQSDIENLLNLQRAQDVIYQIINGRSEDYLVGAQAANSKSS